MIPSAEIHINSARRVDLSPFKWLLMSPIYCSALFMIDATC